jgi:hypothetical protein
VPAPASKLAEAPAIEPVRTTGTAAQQDHRFALIVLAAALLVIAGPVLWAARFMSRRTERAQRRSALAQRLVPEPVPGPN